MSGPAAAAPCWLVGAVVEIQVSGRGWKGREGKRMSPVLSSEGCLPRVDRGIIVPGAARFGLPFGGCAVRKSGILPGP